MRMFRTSPRTTPAFVILGAGLLALALGGVTFAHADPTEVTPASAPTGSGAVAEPTGGNGTVSGTPGVAEPTGDGALHVEPVPGVKNARQVSIDHIAVAADGTTVTVYWYGGVDTCYALEKVLAEPNSHGVLVITLFEGTLPNLPDDQPCIELAQLKATTITVATPLYVDGSLVGG